MANEDFSDESGTYTPEPDPVAVADAAAKLAEQMRLEEEAALRALPLQRREQASDYAAWQAGGSRPGDVQPILPLKYGSRMPTSQGYMYMGNPVASPAPRSPLAATRAYEGAMMRQNIPAANESYQQLAGMDLVPRGTLAGINRDVPMPAATRAEQQYEATRRYDALVAAGVPKPQAAQEAMIAISQSNNWNRPMTEAQAVAAALGERRLTFNEEESKVRQARENAKANKPAPDPVLVNRLNKMYADLEKMAESVAYSKDPEEAAILAKKQKEYNDQYAEYQRRYFPTTASSGQIVVPDAAPRISPPVIGRGDSRRVESEWKTTPSGRRFRIVR